MSTRQRSIAACWLLPVYLVAVTVAGWFHNHPAHRCTPPADSGHRCACGDQHSHHSPASQSDGNSPCDSPGHENCPVCQFLVQKPIAAEQVQEVSSAPLPEAVAPAPPSLTVVESSRVHHSRAPPSVV